MTLHNVVDNNDYYVECCERIEVMPYKQPYLLAPNTQNEIIKHKDGGGEHKNRAEYHKYPAAVIKNHVDWIAACDD